MGFGKQTFPEEIDTVLENYKKENEEANATIIWKEPNRKTV
jgi:hypothetical protein